MTETARQVVSVIAFFPDWDLFRLSDFEFRI